MPAGDQVSVVVIGGGATGGGIARDLAMRGLSCLLVEQGDLCAGASSRFHGLLHSGARYAVGDPEAARECAAENAILRRIAPECVEETEGLFVAQAEDDPAWEARWVAACAECGIAAVPLAPKEARTLEPALTSAVRAAYRVPDSAVDGFRMVCHNVMAAGRYGAKTRTYTRLTGVETGNGRVNGVWTRHRNGEKRFVACDCVINAAGAWAGEVAQLAGLKVSVSPDRGLLLAFNHRFTERIINKLRKPSDGDIFVPHGTVVIYGTTSVPVQRPEDTAVEVEEVMRLLDDGEKLFPRLRDYRLLRAFAGTRPLYTPDTSAGRSATRNFVILDHGQAGLEGMLTVTGGKFTTFRLMAEKAVDLACAKLGVNAACRTAMEPLLPAPPEALRERAQKIFPAGSFALAASRLGEGFEDAVVKAEQAPWKTVLLCECELVTFAEFEAAAAQSSGLSLGDIRRRVRLGMGTCQGNFCALRAAAALTQIEVPGAFAPLRMLEDFLEERWHGIRPLLWARQLREVELERGIYSALLNLENILPHALPTYSAESEKKPIPDARPAGNSRPEKTAKAEGPAYDVIVVGAGLAGITAALRAAARGRSVLLLASGAGVLSIGCGSIDLLGVVDGQAVCGDPFASFDRLGPEHPYSLLGAAATAEAVNFIAAKATEDGFSLKVLAENGYNTWLPTALGTLKPVYLAGPGMSPHGLSAARTTLVAGITGMKDFSARLVAQGLGKNPLLAGGEFKPIEMDAPPALRNGQGGGRDVTALDLARFMDGADGQDWLHGELLPYKNMAQALVLPAVLGIRDTERVHMLLENSLQMAVMESVGPPPAVSGLRLQNALRSALNRAGVTFFDNVTVSGALLENGFCRGLVVSEGGVRRVFSAGACIVASGGIYGKGIDASPGQVVERIFKIPVAAPRHVRDWASERFFGRAHAFASMGVRVNRDMRAVDGAGSEYQEGSAMYPNVYFVGGTLQGYDFATEKSGGGVAVATGYAAGDRV